MPKDRLLEVLERWEPVIGLEIHTEITSVNTKMFCGCPVEFGGEPNTRTCPVCLGLPGALPVPNRVAIDATVLAGLATQCEIARRSQFHRKNYFYPDMPKNYQISQYDLPFCVSGHIDVDIGGEGVVERVDRNSFVPPQAAGHEGSSRTGSDPDPDAYVTRIGITRIHLEEDTGKMVHVGGAEGRLAGATHSLVDFNRAGTPLMELVTEPDIRTPEEARRFAQKLRLVWLTLGISDCNMEEGSMRVDANVSVRPRGSVEFGTKAEVKNMNSFKALRDALAHEIVRQAETLEGGGRVVQETRHWDAGAKRTSALRSKEEAHDYRYFPEPDMVPFEFSDEYVERMRSRLPELPDAAKARFESAYDLPPSDATVLTGDVEMAAFYEAAVDITGIEHAKAIANLCVNDFSAHLNAEGISAGDSKVTPAMLAELVSLVATGSISTKQAKDVFAEMAEDGKAPSDIVEAKGMTQLSDTGEIEAVVDKILAEYPDKVKAYRGGKTGLLGFFVGQVMRETGGQANPQVVNDVLRARLEG